MYTGEILALIVAVSWTITALVAEGATRLIGALQLNVLRMGLSILLLMVTLWVMLGHPFPLLADGRVWFWLSLSGLVGYVFGDYCLFSSYTIIGSRWGQLFMTLASPFAAIAAWILLGEHMGWLAWLGMIITLTGIGMSIMSKPQESGHGRIAVKLPLKGILFGIGAGLGQGVGLVLSKVGLEHYKAITPPEMADVVPFAGTMIRAITGFVCFLLIMAVQRQFGAMRAALHNGKGLHLAFWATVMGPFVGVSLSLMAVMLAPAGVAQTLMSLTPILILWPSKLIYGTKVTVKEVIGAVIAVMGVTLFFI